MNRFIAPHCYNPRSGAFSSFSKGFFAMRFLVDRWRNIGTKLYLALGFAVLLTLVSSSVGVYHFERSGDLNYQAETKSVPALEAAWAAAREAGRLRELALRLLTGAEDLPEGSVDQSLADLEAALAGATTLPALQTDAQAVQDAAYDLAEVIDTISANSVAAQEADLDAASLRQDLSSLPTGTETSGEGVRLLEQALRAGDEEALDALWEDFKVLTAGGLEQRIVSLGGGDQGVFAIRRQQLALQEREQGLVADFGSNSAVLEESTATLLDGARSHNTATLRMTVESFDEGRILLFAIGVVSVIAATLAAWLWVGNAVIRRLSRMSERMNTMVGGDLETPVPEVGEDEIGQLAQNLEHFRQQALEVQRLNLVEQLYGELRETNAELQRMQDRLVAQEKLAALGQLVSGVAHEINNPLNFVKNFSEGSLELYGELTEVLDGYRSSMSKEDVSLLDEIKDELTQNLDRIATSSERAIAIVQRMQRLSADRGTRTMTDINFILRQAALQECESFISEWKDFQVAPVFDFDDSVGEQMVVARDFGEALMNLVSNACAAMRSKQGEMGEAYKPELTVSSLLTDGLVEIKVRDNGTGIADDKVGHIFDPFFTTSEGTEGTGLGLSITADVIRELGGDLVVDTVHGEYAEFIIRIPAASESRGSGVQNAARSV